MSADKKKIGIIGFGNMGSAIAGRLKADYQVFVFDKDNNKTKDLLGLKLCSDIKSLLESSDILILAIKPQDFESVLPEIRPVGNNKLVISIAAGITTVYLEKILGKARVVRSMPNLPAKIGQGMICLAKGKYAQNYDLAKAAEIFAHLGETLEIREGLMNAATAISGSGPGYFYYLVENKSLDEAKSYAKDYFIPELKISAERLGFSIEQANILSEVTTRGSIIYLEKTKITAAEAREQVTSKGGTTQAGLEVLEMRGNLSQAVQAALKRAEELSRGA